jgi:hypothetical protein
MAKRQTLLDGSLGEWTSGRRVWTKQEQRRRNKQKRKETTATPSIEYDPVGMVNLIEEKESDFDFDHFDEESEEEMKQAERQTLLQSLQVEAL